MSHNNNKVNAQTPDRTGEITLSLNDLSDVNAGSPSGGEGLIYEAATTSWIAGTVAGAGAGGIINIGRGEQDSYSNSPATSIGAGTDLYLYDTAPTNNIPSASISKYLTTDWVESVTLPAGDYLVWARYAVEFSATGYMTYALHQNVGSFQLSPHAVIGADTTTYAFAPSVVQSRLVLTTSTAIKLRSIAVSGVSTVANQGNTPAEYSQLTIIKVY